MGLTQVAIQELPSEEAILKIFLTIPLCILFYFALCSTMTLNTNFENATVQINCII